ncbi:MAG: chemotaxis response regulator protein-glutamate methylesterase [Hirschia sp.]|nr:chemotaxis response regulator protein-glutamate methylesterase [Hirschia sp.]MBF18441.1 chemotaxis response regulator protein-glutamate methylesterase [Hirschia sp.]
MTIRVLIVDDSPSMRGLITAILNEDPEIEVVGSAGDPHEARKAIKQLNPDVITLDVEMPRMNGLEFLEKIMRLRPMPVVMVSTLTQSGADTTLRALELGAVDCVGKPTNALAFDSFGELSMRVKNAARARVRPLVDREPPAQRSQYTPGGKIIAFGSSTGGVEALIEILKSFPENCPPTVITQHMPAKFTKSFAQRLNKICAPEVAEAHDGAPLKNGQIWLAPGGDQHLIVEGVTRSVCRLVEGGPVSGHCPSVDALFRSIAKSCGAASVGVILTGMGTDGADGLMQMRRAGARTFGQDENSCVVYGMPRAASEIGAVEKQIPLMHIANTVLDTCEMEKRKAS